MGNKEKVYQFVKEGFAEQYNLTWLQPIGFNNAYALMMRKQQADSTAHLNYFRFETYVDRSE